MSEKLRIAMFGQKRLSREGGIEIVVRELATRMVENGHEVTCYNRSGHHVSGNEFDDTCDKEMFQRLRKKDWLLSVHHFSLHYVVLLVNMMWFIFMQKDRRFFVGFRSC